LLDSGKKLKGVVLSQQVQGLVEQQHRIAGDWDLEVEHAREAAERAREKHKQ
jgi:hypothetical protein